MCPKVCFGISSIGYAYFTITQFVRYCLCTCLPAETCPTVCLAGEDGGKGALKGATLAGSGHLAVGSLSEDYPGATVEAALLFPVTYEPILIEGGLWE
jgi:hypothetical protein